jgi:hypothetical protein
MTDETFWSLIKKANESEVSSPDKALQELLVNLSADEIFSFAEKFRHYDEMAYRWDLWNVAFIIEGGCSDDGFSDFCCWLISQGEDFYKKCLLNPESVAERADDGISYEDFGYAAQRAYKEKTGNQLPPSKIPWPKEPKGRRISEDELVKQYPSLCARFNFKP